MIGNIVGQPLNDYVADEINIRQKTHGSGFDNNLRTPEQINYLNSRLSWVKMASSVEIVDKPSLTTSPTTTSTSQPSKNAVFIEQNKLLEHGEGTKKLTEIFGENISSFQGIGLAKKAILFNGLTETIDTETSNTGSTSTDYIFRNGISTNGSIWNNGAYGLGGLDYGIQPMPGVTNVDINHLNRGSIRKATVKLKAYNKKQFEILEILYLRLGYTMLLEWGNNIYLNKNQQKEDVITTLVDNYWFKSGENSSHLQNLTKIEEYRKKYQGNYDGFFGRVSNFSWTFAPDGSYDITIDLISLGDVVESLKVNVFDKNPKTVTDTEDSNIKLDKISDFLFDLRALPVISSPQKFISFQDKYDALLKLSKTYTKDVIENYRNEVIDIETKLEEIKAEGNRFQFTLKPLTTTNSPTSIGYNHYIRFGAFLNFLQEHIILQVTNNGNTYFPIINVNNDKDINLMYTEQKQFSIDPRICIVKNDELEQFSNVPKTTENIKLFNKIIPRKFLNIQEGGIVYGNVMNIYLNFDFILTSLGNNLDSKGNLSVFNFLDKICKGINKSLGGINNLEPIINENTNSITILDQSVIPGKNILFENKNPIIEMYGYGTSVSNFVKDFSFQTEITPDLSTIITIGTTANSEVVGEEATAFSKWNLGLEDRFNRKIKSPNLPDLKDKEPFTIEELKEKEASLIFELDEFGENLNNDEKQRLRTEIIDLEEKAEKQKNEKLKQDKKEAEDKIYNESLSDYLLKAFGPFQDSKYLLLDDKFISRGENILKNNLLKDVNEEFTKTLNPGSSIGFIPFNLSITLDGISGIKIYNRIKLNSKFLPSNYPNTLEFLIKQVNHSLSNNVWETKLETITIPKVKTKSLTTPRVLAKEGAPIFTSPVIGMPQRNDAGGAGFYGAPRERIRDGQKVSVDLAHKGYDVLTKQIDSEKLKNNPLGPESVGTSIYAPISGIAKIGLNKKGTFKKLTITGTGLYKGYTVNLFYIKTFRTSSLKITNNTAITRGKLIGTSVDLSFSTEKPGEKGYNEEVLDHIHFEILQDGKFINPSPGEVITYQDPRT
tara:strand:- start:671 stop:3844 length:3174 start_codon:yes stop_codon:yes gene_type:complete